MGPNDITVKLSDLNVYLVSPDCGTWAFKKERSLKILQDKGLNPIHIKSPLKQYGGAKGFIDAINVELQIQYNTVNEDFKPFIVFEDDIDVYKWVDQITIPKSADCVWLGISKYELPPVRHLDGDVSQIFRMYSNHGMMFCKRDFAVQFRQRLQFAFDKNLPYDIPTRIMQQLFEVYALNIPLVYQNDPNFQDNVPMTYVTLREFPEIEDSLYKKWQATRLIDQTGWI